MIGKAIKRRGFLGALLGAGAAASAPQTVGLKAAAAALGVGEALTATEVADHCLEGNVGGLTDGGDDMRWMLINLLERSYYAKRRPIHEMPPHIAGKRSWSPAYKAMVFAREEAIMQAYLDKVRRDRGFMDKAIEYVFGGGGADDPA